MSQWNYGYRQGPFLLLDLSGETEVRGSSLASLDRVASFVNPTNQSAQWEKSALRFYDCIRFFAELP
jgi:hypothetical protein